jgi:hypothetical protein
MVAMVLISACSSNTKQELKSDSGKFSITAPGELKEELQSVDTDVGKIDIHMYTLEKSGRAYVVGYSDYPQEMINQTDPQKLLDGGRDGAMKNVSGKLIKEKKITLKENPGRELVLDGTSASGQEATIMARLFLVGNRLYQVMVVTPKGADSSSETSDFLGSFKLLEE